MDYPNYVPAGARREISRILELGQDLLTGTKMLVAEHDQSAADRIRNHTSEATKLARQKIEAVRYRDGLAADARFLHRLATDERMREVYAILTREFSTDEQWGDFVYNAWAANISFDQYRETLNQIRELVVQIADTAEKLAQLLRKASRTNPSLCPHEFSSIPALLRITENPENEGRDRTAWHAVRDRLAGFAPPGRVQDREQTQPELKTEPVCEASSFISDAWSVAPPFTALLDALASVARYSKPREPNLTEAERDYELREFGMIGAAINSRQRNRKTEYLRAFGHLQIECNVAFTPGVVRAMAITATVAVNCADVVASEDDVRKALAKVRRELPQNSVEE